MDEQLATLLREKHPDVSEREVALFEHLWRVWPYLPAELTDLPSGERVAKVINDDIERMYGLRFRIRKDEHAERP